MKTTMDYVVGNTAIQIVNTGRKIKVIDVGKKKRRKYFARVFSLTMFSAVFLLGICFYIVDLQNTSTMLNRQNYALQGQIEDIRKDNMIMEREIADQAMDYKAVYAKALALGMGFPTEEQVYEYDIRKSTVVRVRHFADKRWAD